MKAACKRRAINVAGMVIHVAPGKHDAVHAALAHLPGVDIHGTTDDHRIVATAIDTADTMAIEQLAAMNRIPGVITAMLAYHEIDDAADGAAPGDLSAPSHTNA